METVLKVLLGIPMLFGFAFLVGLMYAYPVMWTWNYTFPAVFDLPVIDVWQALWGSVCMKLVFPSSSNTTTK